MAARAGGLTEYGALRMVEFGPVAAASPSADGWLILLAFVIGLLILSRVSVGLKRASDARFLSNLKGRHEEERRQQEEERRLEAERHRAEWEERERQRKAEWDKYARERWVEYHRCMRIDEVDEMDGRQFERFLKTLFERLGYKHVRETSASGDQGGDLVGVSPDNKLTVVQAKRWKGAVGNSAIQEVLGAMLSYGAEIAFVVTSSVFTPAAKALASLDARIRLVDRAELAEMLRQAFPREVPEFDLDKYNQFVKGWCPYQPKTAAAPKAAKRTRYHGGRRGGHRRRRRW